MSIKQMREVAQPPSMTSNDRFNTFFWMRKFSIYFSWLFLRIGLSADQVLIMSGVSGIIGVCCLSIKIDWLRVAGALFVFFSLLLDFSDGEVARLKNQSSIRGIWHDRVWHEIVLTLLWLCFGYGQYAKTGHEFYLFLAFAMTVFGPWPSEIDERAQQVTLALVATRDGLPKLTNNITSSKRNEIRDEVNRKERKDTRTLRRVITVIKFPIRSYELISDLGLCFLLTALIDVFWGGMVIRGITITAEGAYLIVCTFLTVPFSVKRIIISGKNKEVEHFVELASKKVIMKQK